MTRHERFCENMNVNVWANSGRSERMAFSGCRSLCHAYLHCILCMVRDAFTFGQKLPDGVDNADHIMRNLRS